MLSKASFKPSQDGIEKRMHPSFFQDSIPFTKRIGNKAARSTENQTPGRREERTGAPVAWKKASETTEGRMAAG